MSKNKLLLISAFFTLFTSCKNNKAKDDISTTPKVTEIDYELEDTVLIKQSFSNPDTIIPNSNPQPVPKAGYLKNEDAILKNPPDLQIELKQHLDWLKKKWQNAPNPITAIYQGNDFGDYQHILFKDAKGETYDFGQAANNYGKYQLHERSGQYNDNPAYLGKQFKVYWDWKLSDFLCCEGDYDRVKAYLPAITKLELIKK